MLEIVTGNRVALGIGGPAVQLPLIVHVAAGIVGIVTGYVALAATKGARLHRRSGVLFVYAMLVMGLVGAAIAAYEGKASSVTGGLMAAYFVVTALTTVRPRTVGTRRLEAAAMVVALAIGARGIAGGLMLVASGVMVTPAGVPVPMIFLVSGCTLAAALGDFRVLRTDGLRGAARLARHVWRMCFALFIATGSFFLGQAKVIPKPIRIYPILSILALLPLAAMAYWLWRVRGRRRLRGLVVAGAAEAA